tara:strand:- start:406 stop:573 length:168 start_codon:yes stop_codon:yes gene_type:complete
MPDPKKATDDLNRSWSFLRAVNLSLEQLFPEKVETGNFSGVGHGLLGSISPSPSF